jgi:ribose transport system permease protein
MTSTENTPKVAAPGTPPAASERGGFDWRRLSLGRYTGVVVGLLLFCAYLTITEPVFLTENNITNIVKANSVVFVLAIGTTFVVLTAGIDLSIASATTACAMIFGLTMQGGWGWVGALVAAVAFGLSLGLLNGFLIGKAGISFFVVTLGTLSIYSSFALVVNDGATINLFSMPSFGPIRDFVNNEIAGVPVLLLFDLLLLLVAGGVLRYTRFGRAVYAVGSNPEAARLTGIRVGAVLVSVYAISGLCAGMAAIVQAGRLTGASAQVDPTLLLTVIAAVLIGGTSYTGGEGGVLGTLIGVLFLGVVQNGLALSEVSTFWQGTVSGVILIAAVGLGVLRERGWRIGRRAAAVKRHEAVEDRA